MSRALLFCLLALLIAGCPSGSPGETVRRHLDLLVDAGPYQGQHERGLTYINDVDHHSLLLTLRGSASCIVPVALGTEPRLLADIGVLRPVWSELQGGVVLRIEASLVSQPEKRVNLLERRLDPFEREEDRRWVPIEVDLSAFAGKRIQLRFSSHSDAVPDTERHVVAFGEPRLTDHVPRPRAAPITQVERVVLDLLEGRLEGKKGRPAGIPAATPVSDEPGAPLVLPLPPGSSIAIDLDLVGEATLEIGAGLVSPEGDDATTLEIALDEGGGPDRIVTIPLDGQGSPYAAKLRLPGAGARQARLIVHHPMTKEKTEGPLVGLTRLRLSQSYPVRRKIGAGEPSVLVLLADTLRAPDLGCYGSALPTSPHLDALARKGTRFTLCTAPASWTLPSVATLFTGATPPSHGVTRVDNARLAQGYLTLAEAFLDAGHATAGFVANPLIGPHTSFDQGFTTYHHRPNGRADRLSTELLDWIDSLEKDEAFFAYVHFMDPHGPYSAPEPFHSRFRDPSLKTELTPALLDEIRLAFQKTKADAGSKKAGIAFAASYAELADREREVLHQWYLGEIAFLDHQIGQLLSELERRGRLDNTVILFTSDHGEGFNEHGTRGHGKNLYEEVLHVPLILVHEGKIKSGTCDHPVSLDSILPTLLRLAQLPGNEAATAPDLLSLLGVDGSNKPLFSVIDTGRIGAVRDVPMAAVRQGSWKLIRSFQGEPRDELYDLAKDPGELIDLMPSRADQAALILLELESWLATQGADRATTGEVSADTLEYGRMLGYIR
jgi:arylsulfatase A-like enzyme